MRMTIGRKIGVSSAFYILMILAISLIAFMGIQVLTKTLYRTQEQSETTNLVTGLQSRTLEIARAQVEYIVTQGVEEEAKWHEAYEALGNVINDVRGRLEMDEELKALDDFAFAKERYKKTFEEIQQVLNQVDQDSVTVTDAATFQRAYDMSLLRSSLLANLMMESGSRIAALNKEQIDRRIKEVSELVSKVQSVFVIVVLMGLVVALGLGFATSRSISKPVVELTRGADAIAEGRLDIRFDIKSKDEIGKLASTFNIMTHKLQASRNELEERVRARTAELKRSNEDLEQFAYVASHDLQAPLRQIAGFVQLLIENSKGAQDAKLKKYSDFVVTATKRMQTLIRDLLLYSRVGKSDEAFDVVDLNETFEATTQVLKDRVDSTHAEITCDALPTVHANRTSMTQLWENLIGNALKYRGEKPPEVHVSCEKHNGEWTFKFKDNGIGIDQRYKERVFNLFSRLHAKDKYEGTGIGLSICKKIVERHGGRIWLESKLGAGSVFKFTLPVESREKTHHG